MLNVGSYGSSVNIYKEDSLFIHDNIPVRINEQANYSVALALVDEIKGLMNFYSSRNFGKNVDTIVLVGESNKNNYIMESFNETFNSNIVVGIEELFDIEEDVQGDLQSHEISKACDILGSMCIPNDKKGYAYMNLLPLSLRNKQKKSDLLKQGIIVVPIALGILAAPYLIFGAMDMKVKYDTNLAQSKLDEITIQYKDIEDIDDKIKRSKDEVAIYDMLSSKSVRWGNILTSIDKSIPYKADLTSIDAYYENETVDVKPDENKEEKQEQKNTNEKNTESDKEESETPIYEQIPNIIEIEGIANNPDKVGQFTRSLSKMNYFESVKLKDSSEDEENGGYTFNIVLVLREGAVSGE
jgi:type IV pilus assembly protein PilM